MPDLAREYDVVIIGGGIQGAGCAQALAARGHSVLLLERNTFGSGTSSKSSKLIHGGLRYLESYQFNLVRKSIAERKILEQIAPSLVKRKSFYLPVYRNQRLKSWQLSLGLSLYALLGNFGAHVKFHKLAKQHWKMLPIKKRDLKAIYVYQDAQTDDQALTRAVIHSATELGATALENAHFLRAEKRAEKKAGEKKNDATYRINLELEGEQQHTHCKLIINCAGPWVNEVLKNIEHAPQGASIDLVQGSHIELDKPIGEGIYYVEAPSDQRAVFIMPWHDKDSGQQRTLVGTTEKNFTGNPANSTPSQEEIDYLLATLKHYFPRYTGQLVASWSGLRVLPKAEPTGHSLRPFSSQPRDTFIQADNEQTPSLISLFGGKLTTYRTTANIVADQAERKLGKKPNPQNTRHIQLIRPNV